MDLGFNLKMMDLKSNCSASMFDVKSSCVPFYRITASRWLVVKRPRRDPGHLIGLLLVETTGKTDITRQL